MRISVTRKVYFLPSLSPNHPNTMAPSGRIIKPAAKVASVERNAAVGFAFGKNCCERIVARLPKDISLFSLKLQETESSFAEWFASDNL